MTDNEAGLLAIARSTRRVRREAETREPAWATDGKPPLEFDGRNHNTSLTLDVGMWDCVLETAYVLTKRSRAAGRRRVNIVDVLETAFATFHELPLEQQIERVWKHR